MLRSMHVHDIITWLVMAMQLEGRYRANSSKLEDTNYIYKKDLQLKSDLQMQSRQETKMVVWRLSSRGRMVS